jgi:uncharacterized protein with von Willebrand factor type A (vWA) domain
VDAFREAEAFIFHTRLVHVSNALRERNAARAVERLSLMAQGLGGGTRIGESLGAFNQWHTARVINSRTAVVIFSDGYDTGDPNRLGEEMARLARRCRRIVWINPFLSVSPGRRTACATMAPSASSVATRWSFIAFAPLPHSLRTRFCAGLR